MLTPRPRPRPVDQFKAIKAAMLVKAKEKLAGELGVPVNKITGTIETKLKASIKKQFSLKIENLGVESAVSSSFYSKEKIISALDRIKVTSDEIFSTTEFNEALEKNSEMLYKTYQAFVKAGFSVEQAFEITLRQLGSRG